MIQSHCLFHIICIKHYFIAQVVEGVRLHNNDFGSALLWPRGYKRFSGLFVRLSIPLHLLLLEGNRAKHCVSGNV